jgi:ABC-2 type transport system permease protein
MAFIKVKLRLISYFRVSMLFDLVSGFAFIGVNIIFWEIIYGNIDSLNGISKSSVYFYLMYVEFFFMTYMCLFSGFSKLWRLIITGYVDRLLVMPANPYYFIVVDSINLYSLIKLIPMFILGVYAYSIAETKPDLIVVLLGFPLVFISVVVYSLIQFSSSCLAFWIGKSSLVDEVSDQITSITSVPHSVISETLKYSIAVLFPMAIIPTNVAMYFDSPSLIDIIYALTVTLFSLSIWALISKTLWKRGLTIYSSFGG